MWVRVRVRAGGGGGGDAVALLAPRSLAHFAPVWGREGCGVVVLWREGRVGRTGMSGGWAEAALGLALRARSLVGRSGHAAR